MQANLTKTWLVALTAGILMTGCSKTPLPVGFDDGLLNQARVNQQLAPTLPPGVVARSISMDPANGNARVGESRRFNVQIKGSDGKIYTDPRLAIWSLSNPQLGTVDANGVLLAQQSGSVKVVATISGLTATANIQVDEALFAWQQVLSPVGVDLHAVKMVSKTEAWAGGDRGVLMRFIQGAWHKEPTFNFPDANVRGLGFANTNLGWAVGNRGNGTSPFVARWTGFNWVQEKLPVSGGEVNAISVLGDRDAWAVGKEDNGDALILHYDGFNWKAMQAPGKGKLNAVQMLSPKSGWAVGTASGLLTTTPLIYKFVNGEWVKKSIWANRDTVSLTGPELTGIKMVSETQGYAVGVCHPPLLKERGVFLSYDPKRDGWVQGQYDSAQPDLDQVPLYAIDMISGTEGWALGQVRQPDLTLERNPKSIFGNLLANKGGVLKQDTNYFSGNLSGSFYAIDLLPSGEGWVVGQNGFILQRTYDWRGTQNAYGSSYGSYGTGTTGGQSVSPVTYGPGGTTVPGTQPVNPY
jgi:hypothetical protein